MVAMMKGWVKMRCKICSTSAPALAVSRLRKAMSSGAMVKCSALSKQKTSATATPASGPNAAKANGGPM